jgi:hypothetical protein
MFETIKYKMKINKLNKKMDKVNDVYRNLISKENDRNKRHELMSEASAEIFPIESEIRQSMSKYLINEAEKLIIPLPELNDKEFWEDDLKYFTKNILTNKGIAQIRSQIRNEKKERSDQYLPWLVLIIGLLGAATGFLSIILKR